MDEQRVGSSVTRATSQHTGRMGVGVGVGVAQKTPIEGHHRHRHPCVDFDTHVTYCGIGSWSSSSRPYVGRSQWATNEAHSPLIAVEPPGYPPIASTRRCCCFLGCAFLVCVPAATVLSTLVVSNPVSTASSAAKDIERTLPLGACKRRVQAQGEAV